MKLLVGARMLLGAPGRTTRSKKLLVTRASLLGARTLEAHLASGLMHFGTTVSHPAGSSSLARPSNNVCSWLFVVQHPAA